jgi:hydrogenase 3 maturation protease
MGPSPKSEDAAWLRSLGEVLSSFQKGNEPVRLAIVGIGNELSADDGAGVQAARALRARLGNQPQYLVLEGGMAPENFGGPLRRFQPDLVLMIDAVQMETTPGRIVWLQWEQIDGLSASTHTMPPSVMSTYLVSELKCRVALLGIQVACLDFGQPLSAPVQQAGESMVDGLTHLLLSKYHTQRRKSNREWR